MTAELRPAKAGTTLARSRTKRGNFMARGTKERRSARFAVPPGTRRERHVPGKAGLGCVFELRRRTKCVILSAAKNPRVRAWHQVRSRGFFAALRMTNHFEHTP